MISQEKWYDEDLDSDNEVRATKERKLQEAKDDKGEVPRIIKLQSANFEQPLARNSPRLQLARKTLAASRNKKQLQGLYEAIPEGAALVKTTDSTVTIKVPGQQDTVLNKSDVAKFGTPEQRHIPLINFAARKTVRNHHAKFISSIESHAQDIKSKLIGQRAIRKRETTTSKKAKANLSKVNRIKIPHKKCYQPSPKKGSPKKRKLSTESSQASDEEQDNEPLDTDSNPESKAATKHHGSTYPIDPTQASTRRSVRDKKKPKRYGDLTELSSSDESPDLKQPKKRRAGTSIASYSPPRQPNTGTTVSPPHSIIPTITPYQNQMAENIEDPPQAQEEDASHGDVLTIYDQDMPECQLQPHEL